jgi:uncharacterized membrane protein
MSRPETSKETKETPFDTARLTALSHLYRAEMDRSKVWRTRLDTTTNWAVGTTGIALSVTFSHAEIPPIPLLLITLLMAVFLHIEARRYRYFDIWRTRARLLEVCLFAPLLRGLPISTADGWNDTLALKYEHPHFEIGYWEAAGRRLRRNYIWIFLMLGVSYLVKVIVHPTAVATWGELCERAAVGPVPGCAVLTFGAVCYAGIAALALYTRRYQSAAGRVAGPEDRDPREKYGLV